MSSFLGFFAKRPALKLIVFCFLLAATAQSAFAGSENRKVINIEAAMRAWQERVMMLSPFGAYYPENRRGQSAEPYPEDGFYGADLLDPVFAASLVDYLYWEMYFDVDEFVVAPAQNPVKLAVPDVTIDESNYVTIFAQLVDIIHACKVAGRTVALTSTVATRNPGNYDSWTRAEVESSVLTNLTNSTVTSVSIAGGSGAPQGLSSWETLRQELNYRPYLQPGAANKTWYGWARMSQRTYTADTSRARGTGEVYIWTKTVVTQFQWSVKKSEVATTGYELWQTFPLGNISGIGTLGVSIADAADFSSHDYSAMQPLNNSDDYKSIKQVSKAVCLFLKTTPTRRVDNLMVEVACPCSSCAAGETKARNECVKVTMSLGTGPKGAAGELYINEISPTDLLSSPRLLRLRTNGEAVATYAVDLASQPYIRQVVSPQALTDVVIVNPHSYRVDFYKRAFQGAIQPDGTYAVTGDAYRSVTIENPDQTTPLSKVRVTIAVGSTVLSQTDYLWDVATSGWTMAEAGGSESRSTSRSSVASNTPGERIETIIEKDGNQNVTGKRVLTYKVFPWNIGSNAINPEELIREVVDPDGEALTTAYEFYETTNFTTGAQASRVKLITLPSGHWTKFEYYNDGATERVTTPWGNTPYNQAGKVRYRRTVRSPSTPNYTLVEEGLSKVVGGTPVEQILKAEHRHREQQWADPYGSTVQLYVEHETTGQIGDRVATITSFYNNFYMDGLAAGKIFREVNPDGTGRVFVYRTTPEGLETTTYEGQLTAVYSARTMPTFPASGVISDDSTVLIAGTKTIIVEDENGAVLTESAYSLPSGTLINGSEAVEMDELGRVTLREYLDGTSEEFHYACCGLEYTIDREGIRTDYHYNGFKELEGTSRAGIRTKQYEEFVAGKLNRVTTRIGSVNATPPQEIEQRREIVDLAGRTLSVREFDLRTTLYSEEFLPTGETVRTTTNPDLGTRIETFSRDGELSEVAGTAAAHEKHEEGFDTGGYYRLLIRVADDLAETEWVKTYYDLLGRPVKILYPDDSYSETEYHPLAMDSRIKRQRDPDGVTILKDYIAATATSLAEEITAVNMADADPAVPTIDLSGTDRITRTTREVTTRTDASTSTPVERLKTEIWLIDDEDAPHEVSVTDTSLDGLTTWQQANGMTTKSVTVIDTVNQTRTQTTTYADKTSLVRVFVNGRLQSETRKDKAGDTATLLTYGYDIHGRRETVTDNLGRTTTTTYYDDDQVHTLTSPDPDTAPAKTGNGYDAQTTTYTYDEAGRVWKVEQHDGALTETIYWGNGKVKRVSGGRIYPQAYTYDVQGRVKTLTTWHDFAGQDRAAVTTWSYDPERGWLESKEYDDGKGPVYAYTPAGRLFTRTWARTVDGSPLVTTYGYSAAGELNSITYSDATPAVAHTYDRGGRLHTSTDAAGLLTRSYDTESLRLSGEAYTGTGELSGRSIARTYDQLHRPQSLATDGGYGLGYSYDKAGRLEMVNQGFHSATFGYEAGTSSHNRTTVKRVGVERVRHDRNLDRIGRISSVTSTVGGTAAVARTYTYNDANQRTRAEIEDGRRWAYGYDPLGQVTSAQKLLADDITPLPGYTFSYTFDDIGNRTQATANGRTAAYNADLLNRYENRVVPRAFDVRGEAHADAIVTVDALATTRTGKDFYREVTAASGSAAVSQDIEIEAARTTPPESASETRTGFLPQTPEEFDHDDDGNLKQDGRWDYHWDAENRLIGMVTRPDIATDFSELKKRITFAYDAQGRRIRKTVEDWNPAANGGLGAWVETLDLLFLYDGWNLLTELDANNSNVLLRSHAWGLDLSGSTQGAGGVGGLLWTNTPTHTFAPCFDGNGNTIAWINTGTLAVSGRADYGAFGESVMRTGVANTLPFGFSTKYQDNETDLIYYGRRFYSVSLGSWLNRDPIQEDGGFNLHAMTNNDALNQWDYLGMACQALLIFGHTTQAVEDAITSVLADLERQKTATLGDGAWTGTEPPKKDETYGDVYGAISCFPDIPNGAISQALGSTKALFKPGDLDKFLGLKQDGSSPLLYEDGMKMAFKFAVEKAMEVAAGKDYAEGKCSVIRIQIRCAPKQANDKIWASKVLGSVCGKTLELEVAKIKAGKGYADIKWESLQNGATTARFRE